ARRHEYLGTLYPASDRDVVADARDPGLWHRRLRAPARGGAAACRFPDDHRLGELSRGEPGHDGLGGRDAARTAIRLDPEPRPDDLDERHRDDLDHDAVRAG